MSMTKKQIQATPTKELQEIVRSTYSTPNSSSFQETALAREELARRLRLRDGIKDAIVGLGGTVTQRN